MGYLVIHDLSFLLKPMFCRRSRLFTQTPNSTEGATGMNKSNIWKVNSRGDVLRAHLSDYCFFLILIILTAGCAGASPSLCPSESAMEIINIAPNLLECPHKTKHSYLFVLTDTSYCLLHCMCHTWN